MSWIDSLNFALYTLIYVLSANAWSPFVYAYNRVVVELEHIVGS